MAEFECIIYQIVHDLVNFSTICFDIKFLSGLGLAIVKEIVHAHHENINVISTEGVGTEFIFTLPYINVDTDFVSVDS